MRADAKKNREHLLAVAQEVVRERGADASLRDISRRAGVGLATLYRHFPTREALLEALLRAALDDLTKRAIDLEGTASPDHALVSWLREAVAFVGSFNGVVARLADALADTSSALHTSCTNLRSAGDRLLRRAQEKGVARRDLDGIDLFALIGALGWIGDQPTFAPRCDRLFVFIVGAMLTNPSSIRAGALKCDSEEG